MVNICAPALIYVAFSLTQIVIDTFKGLYNTAFLKVIVMIIITILLNALCQGGMTIISWIIVFVPFMFMSLIVGILLYVFGLDAATGTLNIKCDQSKETPLDKVGNLIYTIEDTKNTNNSSSNNGTMDVSYSEAPYGTTDPEFN